MSRLTLEDLERLGAELHAAELRADAAHGAAALADLDVRELRQRWHRAVTAYLTDAARPLIAEPWPED